MRSDLDRDITNVNDFAKELERKAKEYRDSLMYTKTVALADHSEEAALPRLYKNFILEEQKPEGYGGQAPDPTAMATYTEKRKQAVLSPRLLSMQGYQDLFEQALTNSWLRRRQDKTDEEIKELKEEIQRLKDKDDELQGNLDILDGEQNEKRREALAN